MTEQNDTDLMQLLADQLRADPLSSKKFLAALGAGTLVTFMFIASLILLFINSAAFGVFAGFATTAVTSVAALAAAYIGGQAAVEFKANSTLQSTQEAIKTNGKPLPVVVQNKPTDPVPTAEEKAKPDNPD